MSRIYFFILILIQIAHGFALKAQESSYQFSGYIKSLQSVVIPGTSDTISSSNLIHNRLNFKVNFDTHLSLRFEIRNRLFFGDQLKQIPGFGDLIDQDNGFWKLSKLWTNSTSLVAHSIIDRLQLAYANDKIDISLGRQRINWGIHNFWNPNDIFNSFNFLDFDFEERPGSDAIRIQYFTNSGSTFEAAFKPGKKSDTHTAGLLYKFNRNSYDFQFMGGLYNTDLVIGGGWAGGIHETGWKGEFSYFIPYKKENESKQVFVFTTMVDQTFPGEWYISLAALLQTSEGNSSPLINAFSGLELSAKNLFPSKFSVLGGFSKSFSNLISVNLSALYATKNNMLILLPTFNWNASDNLQIDLTGQSFFSKVTTTYGCLAHSVYLRVKWSF
jgi:hypothetical protein